MAWEDIQLLAVGSRRSSSDDTISAFSESHYSVHSTQMACDKIKGVWKKAFQLKNFKVNHDKPEIFVKSQGSNTFSFISGTVEQLKGLLQKPGKSQNTHSEKTEKQSLKSAQGEAIFERDGVGKFLSQHVLVDEKPCGTIQVIHQKQFQIHNLCGVKFMVTDYDFEGCYWDLVCGRTRHALQSHGKKKVFGWVTDSCVYPCLCNCKDSITPVYIFYRVVVAAFFVAALLASITGAGRVETSGWKWLIYLTSWGLTLCTVQSIFGLVIVLNAKLKKQNQVSVTAGDVTSTLPLPYKIYWAIHTTAVTVAVCITISFWAAVYNPEQHPLDAVNILSHAMNGIMMTIDLFIVGHPMWISHVYLPLCFTLVYCVFNGIYYLAGGTDKSGRTFIYAILNWEKTDYAFLACFLGLIFVAAVHTVLSVISSRCKYFAARQQIQISGETNVPC